MSDGKSQGLSFAQLLGDARRGVADLLHAELNVFSLEIQTKIDSARAPFVWLVTAAVSIVFALALGVLSIFLLMLRLGIRAPVAAAILFAVFLCVGLFALMRGLALMRRVRVRPDRTMARLRDDATALKESFRNA